jgi:hypothetical protein
VLRLNKGLLQQQQKKLLLSGKRSLIVSIRHFMTPSLKRLKPEVMVSTLSQTALKHPSRPP